MPWVLVYYNIIFMKKKTKIKNKIRDKMPLVLFNYLDFGKVTYV